MKPNLVTVVMAAFNAENHIERAIESVRNQSFKNWELLCVNDGSRDKTGEIIDRYAVIDSRIRCWHQDNKGPAAARCLAYNNGLGGWYLILDSDDFFDQNTLKLLLEQAAGKNCDAVVGDWVTFNADRQEWQSMTAGNGFAVGDTMNGQEAFALTVPWKIHGVCLWRAEIIKKIATKDEYAFNRYNADEFLTRRLYLECKIVVIGAGRYYRTFNPDSLTKARSALRYMRLDTDRRLLALAEDFELPENIRNSLILWSESGVYFVSGALGEGRAGGDFGIVVSEIQRSVNCVSKMREHWGFIKAWPGSKESIKGFFIIKTMLYFLKGVMCRLLKVREIRSNLAQFSFLRKLRLLLRRIR